MRWAGWTGCSGCVGGPTPGARHLLAWLREEWPQGRSLGIYACRDVRGSSARSLHACGRAVDYGLDMVEGRANPAGRQIAATLGAAGDRLGVQAVIFDRTIWSAKSPDGRRYDGVHPHYDHAHIELTVPAGQRLTLATLRAVLRRGGETEMDDYERRLLQEVHAAVMEMRRWAEQTRDAAGRIDRSLGELLAHARDEA